VTRQGFIRSFLTWIIRWKQQGKYRLHLTGLVGLANLSGCRNEFWANYRTEKGKLAIENRLFTLKVESGGKFV
jgi:hypothetical protein